VAADRRARRERRLARDGRDVNINLNGTIDGGPKANQ